MVAEAEAPPKTPKRGLIGLVTRAKARNLYVVQMLAAREVAVACGLTDMQVYKLAQQHGWAELRRQRTAKLSGPLQARELQQAEEISIAAASLSDQGMLGSLMRANEAAESRGEFAAKDCQAFASAARSLMQVGRTLRGLDGAGAKGGDTVTNNLIFVGGAVRVDDAIDVTPAALPAAKADASTHP